MNQERSSGRFNKAKGKVKGELGRAAADRSTEWSGKLEQVKGSIQDKIGKAKLDTRRFADGLRVR